VRSAGSKWQRPALLTKMRKARGDREQIRSGRGGEDEDDSERELARRHGKTFEIKREGGKGETGRQRGWLSVAQERREERETVEFA